MNFVTFIAGKDDNERRLDKIARKFLSSQGLSLLYKSIRSGLIKVNDKKSKSDTKIFQGDKISFADFLINTNISNNNEQKNLSDKVDFSLEKITIFKNEHILIIDKPYNINVQKAKKDDISLDQIVTQEYKINNKNSTSLSFKPGPLHRLDKKTTGLLSFSQSLEGSRYFSYAIKNHLIKKTYIALVEGKLKTCQKWSDKILKKDETNSTFKTVIAGSLQGKTSITIATPLAYGSFNSQDVTLVKFEIQTGRTHQIRSQSSLHGHPLLGDTAYNASTIDLKKYKRDFFLHALSLEIPKDNPLDLPLKINCPIDDNFKKILNVSLINMESSLNI